MLLKRITLLFFFLFSLTTIHSYAQAYWVERAGGTTIDAAVGISTDTSGFSYATGYFTSTANFGATNLVSAGSTDIYITKLNHNGQYIWAKHAGGSGTDKPTGIKADKYGNSYITGFFYGTAQFGTFSITSEGIQDVFIAKYDNLGNCLWAKSCGGAASDIGNAITVDNSGNVIITGQFLDSANFGPFHLISMNHSVDVFTAKLDSVGNFLWVKQGAAPYIDRGLGVACDASNNIYVTGQFSDTITFEFVHDNAMYNAIFLVKYDSLGNELWFRRAGGGGLDVPTGIVVDNAGNPIITGDFQGNLTVFSAPNNSTISDTYFNRVFVLKYDTNGNKLWASASSSDGSLSSNAIAIDTFNNPYIIGDFGCRLNKYADVYGQGTFNSVGYNDIYVTKWNAGGTWLWSRQIGGQQDDDGAGIAIDTTQNVLITGSFNFNLWFPIRSGHFLNYNNGVYNFNCATFPYCGDTNYDRYAEIQSSGNSDIFIAKGIDPIRQPLDYYRRTDSSCNRDVKKVEIYVNNINNPTDSVKFCTQGQIEAAITCGPGYITNYTWSNSSTNTYLNVNTSGQYRVTVSSEDGCFSSFDSIYVSIRPLPPTPTITDNHGFNTNAISTTTIELCRPDSVTILNAGIADSLKYQWFGGPLNDSTLTVTHSGEYVINVADSFGCTNSNYIHVVVDSTLTPIIPGMYNYNDTNRSDTITLCAITGAFQMVIYDKITNPSAQYIIDPLILAYDPYTSNSEEIHWSVTPNTVTYNTSTINNGDNFHPTAPGWYTVTATIIRQTACDSTVDTVSHSIYVILNPNPILIQYNPVISGITVFCPGDSTLLVASGLPSYHWSTNSTNDSVYARTTGNYEVYYIESDTNSYGCVSTQIFEANVNVSLLPQPTITLIPSNGVICPNDSVELICSGTGTYTWQGPNGPFGGNNDTVYATASGDYDCLFTNTAGCQLVSNDIEIEQYNTPFVEVLPDAFFCPGDSILLSVISSPGSIIQWQSPLSGSNPNQYVHIGGIYTCSINSCNILTSSANTIIEANPFAGISVAYNYLCPADTLVLYATLGMSTYFWLPDSSNYTTDTAIRAGLYKLLVTDPYGCTATDSIAINVANDSVRSLFTSSPLTGCNPLTVAFTSTSYNGDSLLWNFGDNGTSNAINPTHTYSISGTYSIILIAYHTNACGIFIDTLVRVNYITVYPLITASFTAFPDSGCIPFVVNFNNASTNATSYFWNFGDTYSSIGPNPSHTYDSSGIFTITLIASDSMGCRDTMSLVDYIHALYPLAPMSSFTANPLSGCDSLAISFTNTSLNATNYLWLFGDGTTDTATNPVHFYDTTGSYSITLISYNISICGTLIDTVTQKNIINITPSAHASFITNDSLGCPPYMVSFINTSTLAVGYSWSFEDGNFSSVTNPSNVYLNAGIYSVTLVAIGGSGCNDTAVFNSISVFNPPVVSSSFSADTFRGCAPLTITFNNTSINGTSFIWNFGDSTTGTDKNPVHTFTDSGLFTIKLLTICDTSVCGIFKDSTTINDYIEVADSIKLKSSFLAIPMKGCSPLIVEITNTTGNGILYYWDFGNGQSYSDTTPNPAYYYKASTYTITLISAHPNDRCYTKPDTTSIEVEADSCLISIPNTFTPNNDGYNDFFNVICDGCTNYHLVIFNRWGQKLFESYQNNLLWDGYDSTGIQVPDGTYYYYFTATDYNEEEYSQKGFISLIR